jgi:hypothetical protein
VFVWNKVLLMSGDVDVFSGPVVEAAMKAAASVGPGTLVRTAFSAYDTGDLIGLEGARAAATRVRQNCFRSSKSQLIFI